MLIPISKVGDILGVSLSTVYRMLKRDVLKESFRTEGKHRRFNFPSFGPKVLHSPPFGPRVFYVHDIHQLQRKTYEPRVITYARVSTNDQQQISFDNPQPYMRKHYSLVINRFNRLRTLVQDGMIRKKVL